jgi:AbrB family looped-hinge helix DNA binding protein
MASAGAQVYNERVIDILPSPFGATDMRVVLSKRNQIAIPKSIRDRLGLIPGSLLELREESGTLLGEKVAEDDAIAQVRGSLKLNKPTDELLDEIRGPA